MSVDATSQNEQTHIDPSIYWERSGVLARASTQGALFSLYLAMQQHSTAAPFEIEAADSELSQKAGIDTELTSLSHYRRSSLAANESEWKNMDVMSALVAEDFSTARLYLNMNPAPLAQTDDAKRLPDDVIDNCSLAAQKRIKKQYNNTMKEDNTLLYDMLATKETQDPGSNADAVHTSPFENIA
ncbi:MAG TPA: hypothetical protein DDZ29_14920 [Alteromonas mediterranea]|nr:hypothetical protein [Alteromonas mediterranea]